MAMLQEAIEILKLEPGMTAKLEARIKSFVIGIE